MRRLIERIRRALGFEPRYALTDAEILAAADRGFARGFGIEPPPRDGAQ